MDLNATIINISFYLPSLLKFIPPEDPDWVKIDGLFSQKNINRSKGAGGDSITVEASLFDIIIAVKKGNQQAFRLLDFLNKLTTDILNQLDENEAKKISKNIKDICLNLDMKYLNFVGEIAVLHNIMRTGHYQLLDVEAPVENSTKTIDFKFLKKKDSKEVLVEVVNIHLDPEKIEDDPEQIKKFLTYRLQHKIKSKAAPVIFDLVPVIWSNAAALKIYSNYFKIHKMHIEHVWEPVSYLTFIDPRDEKFILHRFANISTLFD